MIAFQSKRSLFLLIEQRFLAEVRTLFQQFSMAPEIKIKAMTAYVLLSNQLVLLFIEYWEMLTDPSLLATVKSILFLS